MGQSFRYKVYFTPLTNAETNTYGDEIDVSDRIEVSGVGSIKRGIDASDYDMGVFFFSDITLKGFNYNGYFNDPGDNRSIFFVARDLCKVRIVFSDFEVTRNSSHRITDAEETETITFRGLINEEGTRLDAVTDTITFKVLALDSVIRTTKIPSGVVNDGDTCKNAMFQILSNTRVTSILNIDIDNINPDYNFTIDDGSKFDNKSIKTMLDKLLLASNSVMLIQNQTDVIIKDRSELTDVPIWNLYGKSDQYGRENIIRITAYNLGLHRTFTAFQVNDTESIDNDFIESYGYRLKKVELDFITTEETETLIGENLLGAFKSPKLEVNVQVSTSVAREMKLLDRVSINYPLRVKPIDDTFLPIIGIAEIGDSETPLPGTYGSISIPYTYGWKIIEITDNPKEYTTILKLRQIDDLVFNAPNNCIVGYAVIGSGAICAGGDSCDTFEVATIGGAQVGCTLIG